MFFLFPGVMETEKFKDKGTRPSRLFAGLGSTFSQQISPGLGCSKVRGFEA